MEWHPHEQAWLSFINFEMRYKELERARAIYERFVLDHLDVKNWSRFARFEEQNGFINGARKVFERAVAFYGEDQIFEEIYISFARFEERQKEVSSMNPFSFSCGGFISWWIRLVST